MTILKDGTIVHPRRGKPPKLVPKGYKADPNDPFVWYPVYEDCLHRKIVRLKDPGCKCLKNVAFCDDKRIKIRKCINCTKASEPCVSEDVCKSQLLPDNHVARRELLNCLSAKCYKDTLE